MRRSLAGSLTYKHFAGGRVFVFKMLAFVPFTTLVLFFLAGISHGLDPQPEQIHISSSGEYFVEERMKN